MAAGRWGRVVQKAVGLAVGAAASQAAADWSGKNAVRNGLGAAGLLVAGGAATVAFDRRPQSFLRLAGESVGGGALAWASGVGMQHLDQYLQTPKSTGTGTAAAADVQAGIDAVRQVAATASAGPSGMPMYVPSPEDSEIAIGA